jgi:hypothetical protein
VVSSRRHDGGSRTAIEPTRPGTQARRAGAELPLGRVIRATRRRACAASGTTRARSSRGDLFVARPGARADGARFVADAVARGGRRRDGDARGNRARWPGRPVRRRRRPPRGSRYAASAVYGHPSFALDVVGITGTNGKTTTTHLVRAAVDGALGPRGCGVIGTVGHGFDGWHVRAEHTTPEADEVARDGARCETRGRLTWRWRSRRTLWSSGACALCAFASLRSPT